MGLHPSTLSSPYVVWPEPLTQDPSLCETRTGVTACLSPATLPSH